MAGLCDEQPKLPDEDPEQWAYLLLGQITDEDNSDPATRALAYAVLALVREQKKTTRLLASQKTPPTMKPKRAN